MSAITAKSWQCLPQNIHPKLQFWIAVQVVVKSTVWIIWNFCLWFTTLFYQQGISLSSSSPVQI